LYAPISHGLIKANPKNLFGVPTPMGCCFPKKGPAVDAWNFLIFDPTRLFCQELLMQTQKKFTQKQKKGEHSEG
jgi:hypothetical protein